MSMPTTPDMSATPDGESRRVTLPVAIRYDTTRYRCPHCRRSYAHQKTADKHIARCFRNPAVRSCKTCRFYSLDFDGFGCGAGVDVSGAFCPVCGSGWVQPDGPVCEHVDAKSVYNLRVQCDLWAAV